MAGFLNTTELDFQSYRDSLKEFLKQQDQFLDYDFDGPNMAVLLDLLAYNAYHHGVYLNMAGSEMFMDSASIRQSIVSHAKELNYCPRSRVSATALVDIKITGNNLPATMTIPKNYQLTGRSKDGKVFTFLTNEAINVGVANNHTAKGVPVYEGKWVRETFVVQPGERFILQSANVDINSIEVQVKASSSNTSTETWVRETTLFGLSDQTPAFFVQGHGAYNYEVTFGNGIVGKKVEPGNIIHVSYRTTLGADANSIKNFSAFQAIEGFPNISVSLSNTNSFATGGAMHESDDDIKFNAPRYFQTQERAVTESDYVTLLRNEFPQLAAVTAFGGESVEPKKYGKTIISAKPRGSDILPNAYKDRIAKFLNNKTTLTIDPIIIDPDYFNVHISSRVTYNLNKTIKTPTELTAAVLQAIKYYNVDHLEDFSADLRYSRLLSYIDNADPSIVSNDTDVMMTKKLYPLLGKRQSYSFQYNNQLADPTDSEVVVYSSPFEWRAGNITYNVFIEDDKQGNLRIVTVDLQDNKVVMQSNVGTVDYKNGSTTISDLVVERMFGNSLNIYARLAHADVETINNQILTIDPSDVQITVNGIRA